jgi:hypothetical protein
MVRLNNEIYNTYTDQPVDLSYPVLTTDVQQQMAMGSIALGTMVCLTVLIREIRLLVEACKS